MPDDNRGLLGVGRRTFLKGLGVVGLASAATGSASAEVGDSGTSEARQLPDRRGPIRKHRFMVEIDGLEKSGFSRVELPDAISGDVEYREGNDPDHSRKLKGSNEYDPLVLEAGVQQGDMSLYEWFKKVEQGKVDGSRRAIAVAALDAEGNPAARWELTQAWPARYDPPDLDASAEGVAIETLEIIHEGVERTQ